MADEESYEMDEHGNLVPVKEPLTLANYKERAILGLEGLARDHLPQQSFEQKVANETAMIEAREAVDKRTVPAAEWAIKHVPGMRALAQRLTATERARHPETRDPHTLQREFSNDQEKEAYLERIRQAQKNAAGSK